MGLEPLTGAGDGELAGTISGYSTGRNGDSTSTGGSVSLDESGYVVVQGIPGSRARDPELYMNGSRVAAGDRSYDFPVYASEVEAGNYSFTFTATNSSNSSTQRLYIRGGAVEGGEGVFTLNQLLSMLR